MKLYYAPPSPYARKVRVLARELGLQSRIEEIAVQTTPVAPAAEVTAVNPLSKIPTLVTDSGETLFDSRVISEYLLSLSSLTQWSQPTGNERWACLRRQALADGILDAALLHRYEMVLRPKELHWPVWLDAQKTKIERGLAQLNEEIVACNDFIALDAIAAGCALSWLEFRMPDIPWRTENRNLANFAREFEQRQSMKDTLPQNAK